MSNQSNESSFAGKSNLTVDPNAAGNLVFKKSTSETRTLMLDPKSAHSVFIATAGACDFSIRASRDSYDAHSKGTAMFGPAVAYNNRNGNMFLGDLAPGVTALEVTCVKNGVAADNGPLLAALGGRAEVRAVKVAAVTAGETAAVTTALTEMVAG